jgi:hypothetical protein
LVGSGDATDAAPKHFFEILSIKNKQNVKHKTGPDRHKVLLRISRFNHDNKLEKRKKRKIVQLEMTVA